MDKIISDGLPGKHVAKRGKALSRVIHKYGTLYVLGAAAYSLLEIAWRGFTHWSMAVTGGVCMCALYLIETRCRHHRALRCLYGAAAITAAEFAAGCIVNLALDWGVWDYSALPLNLYGQICLPFTLLWTLLCIPVGFLCGAIKKHVFS